MKDRTILIALGLGALWYFTKKRNVIAKAEARPFLNTPQTENNNIIIKLNGEFPKRITHFAGKNDLWEVFHGVSFFVEPKYDKESPAGYYEKRAPEWVKRFLIDEIKTATEWPIVEGKVYKYDWSAQKPIDISMEKRPAHLSYYVDTETHYCAIHPDILKQIQNNYNIPVWKLGRQGKLFVKFESPSGTHYAQIIDTGPSGPGYNVFDVSPATKKIIEKLSKPIETYIVIAQ